MVQARPGIQITTSVDYSNFDWTQPAAHRRTIIVFVYREFKIRYMEALDFPDAAQLTPMRTPTASPLQALALWNQDCLNMLRTNSHLLSTSTSDDVPSLCLRDNLSSQPTEKERLMATEFIAQHDLAALIA